MTPFLFKHTRHLGLLFGLALLPACSSAEPDYFTLAPVPGPAFRAAAHLVELRRVGLAGYLDRPDVVVSNAGYRLTISNTQRWGEPLGDMIGRVLAEDLTQRLPGSTVFSEAGAISADTDATVETDIQRFDTAPDGTVTLLAQVAVSLGRANDEKRPAVTRSFRMTAPGHAPPHAAGTAGTVATMSTLLGQLANAIATMLRQD